MNNMELEALANAVVDAAKERAKHDEPVAIDPLVIYDRMKKPRAFRRARKAATPPTCPCGQPATYGIYMTNMNGRDSQTMFVCTSHSLSVSWYISTEIQDEGK